MSLLAQLMSGQIDEILLDLECSMGSLGDPTFDYDANMATQYG